MIPEKVRLAAVLALVVPLAACFGPQATPTATPTPTPVPTYSVKEIVQEYKQNPVRAEARFEHGLVRIAGTIVRIKSDHLFLDGDNWFTPHAEISFEVRHKPAVQGYSVGNRYSILCWDVSYDSRNGLGCRML